MTEENDCRVIFQPHDLKFFMPQTSFLPSRKLLENLFKYLQDKRTSQLRFQEHFQSKTPVIFTSPSRFVALPIIRKFRSNRLSFTNFNFLNRDYVLSIRRITCKTQTNFMLTTSKIDVFVSYSL
jgi:hypothetical protein